MDPTAPSNKIMDYPNIRKKRSFRMIANTFICIAQFKLQPGTEITSHKQRIHIDFPHARDAIISRHIELS